MGVLLQPAPARNHGSRVGGVPRSAPLSRHYPLMMGVILEVVLEVLRAFRDAVTGRAGGVRALVVVVVTLGVVFVLYFLFRLAVTQ